MRRPRREAVEVPATLVQEIEQALETVRVAQDELARAVGAAALPVRRAAFARVTAAFEDADRLLRQATTLTRPGPYVAWREWRHRLSVLDIAKQRHLFAESDDVACLGMGTVRALDTGMAGPSIGELQHGESVLPGTPARYGLDVDEALTQRVHMHAGPGAVASAPAAARDSVPQPEQVQPEKLQPQQVPQAA